MSISRREALAPGRGTGLVVPVLLPFDNPDHVEIVIHNYRRRLGLAPGEHRFDELERKLALRPTISAPTITLASDFDGAAKDGAPYRPVHRPL